MSIANSTTTTNFPDRAPTVFAVTTATLCLSSVFVAARVYCRTWLVKRVGLDDYFIIAAWFLAFGLSFSIDFATHHGLGRHDENIDPADYDELRISEYAFSILYNPALMLTKTSILLFFLRISKDTQPVMKWVSRALLAIVNLAGTILTLLNIFQCKPISAAFRTHSDAKCIPLLTEFVCAAPVNIVTDLAILALPIPVLTGITLPPKQKYILILTFAIWIFVTIVDVIRVYYLQKAISGVPTSVSDDSNAIFGTEDDFAWNASISLMWSAIEVNVGMTCACIPTLKPLIMKLLPDMLIDPSRMRSANTTRASFVPEPPSPEGYREPRPSVIKLPPIGEPTVPSLARQQRPRPAQPVPVDLPIPNQTKDFSPTSATGAGFNSNDNSNGNSNNHSAAEGRDADVHPSEYMDFITALNSDPFPSNETRRGTVATGISKANTLGTHGSMRESKGVYFGFVNMGKPKTMLHVSAADSFKYCTVVTILFFLWGVSYGFLYTLNNAVAAIADLSVAQTLGLTSAYFGGGYFFGPLVVGEWILRHDEHRRTTRKKSSPAEMQIGGFKATFILGLCIYGIGTITLWPSAVLTSWAGFMFSHFVVGFGLAVLETAANPFIALCGPTEYSEMRLLFSQGVQGIGSVLSSLLAQRVFFKNLGSRENIDSRTLIDVQWTYLAITLLCVFLALFFYYMPLPEVTDAELEEAADKIRVNPRKKSVGGLALRTWSLILAIMTQWTYLAAQENVNIFFHGLLTINLPGQTFATNLDGISVTGVGAAEDAANRALGLNLAVSEYLLIAHTALAVSRFAVGYLAYLSPTNSKIPEPRTILLISTLLSLLFGALTVFLSPSNPNMLVIPAVLFFFAEGPIWPLTFALGLRGQGNRTKRAAAFITMGGSGPAFFPFVVYAIVDRGGSIHTAFVVVVVLLTVTCIYPLLLHVSPDAVLLVDPPARHPGEGERSPHVKTRRDTELGLGGLNETLAQRKRRLSGSTLMGTWNFSWKKDRKRSTTSESGS
ncbi:MFS general substrate transporter [Zalerion maritima]|uniref:MFS general substrate transporter n=1 Tax=Zalerion maritima TaxID=339359 RepID=A0AAD5RUF4_9PEZI|nr:MFS general substrate transporter [Zalerion maritima]